MPQVCRRDYTFLKTVGRVLMEWKVMVYLYIENTGTCRNMIAPMLSAGRKA